MQALTCREIISAVKGALVSGDVDTVFTGVSIDSRKIKKGDLFIPIIGQQFDGHDFIQSSIESGAAGALTQRETGHCAKGTLIKVSDTQQALKDMASYFRGKFSIPFVGITGSVGKTSTKDMIASVLEQKYRVLKTQGNLNNEIGMPLTVLNLEEYHEAAVVEMGMSGFGEISRLTSIALPDIAVITNIGLSHIEKLGSRQNILKAKMEILEGLRDGGLVVLNGDDNLLGGLKGLLNFRTVFYGMGEGLDYQAYNIQTAGEQGTYFEITVANSDYNVHIPAPGTHNVYNALAAIAVGIELKVPMDAVIKGITAFSPGKMRLNVIPCGKMKIINDAYNASPQSMEAAINVLKEVSAGARTVAVLGDMLELGEISARAHYDIGKFAVLKDIDYIIAVGEYAQNIALGAVEAGADRGRVRSFAGNRQAIDFLADFLKEGDTMLVKGSRGMKMEEIVNQFTANNC